MFFRNNGKRVIAALEIHHLLKEEIVASSSESRDCRQLRAIHRMSNVYFLHTLLLCDLGIFPVGCMTWQKIAKFFRLLPCGLMPVLDLRLRELGTEEAATPHWGKFGGQLRSAIKSGGHSIYSAKFWPDEVAEFSSTIRLRRVFRMSRRMGCTQKSSDEWSYCGGYNSLPGNYNSKNTNFISPMHPLYSDVLLCCCYAYMSDGKHHVPYRSKIYR